MSKMYMTFVIIFALASNIEARMRMHRSSSRGSYCDYEFVRKLEKEKEILSQHKDYLLKNNNDLNKIITLNNCKPGNVFSKDNTKQYSINCVPCPENHYRTATNHTCYHCPEGYYSKSGWTECKKAERNSSNVHTLCEKGKIIGDNKFAIHSSSCVECYKFGDKKYMPYKNNHDTCLTCPDGSIVKYGATFCEECPIGHYEKDNKCIKCDVGTYSDKPGTTQCKVCTNTKSIAYVSTGGYNCDNSIFHNIAESFNENIIDMDSILNPFVSVLHESIAFVSNF